MYAPNDDVPSSQSVLMRFGTAPSPFAAGQWTKSGVQAVDGSVERPCAAKERPARPGTVDSARLQMGCCRLLLSSTSLPRQAPEDPCHNREARRAQLFCHP
jgi:hypothetical protein